MQITINTSGRNWITKTLAANTTEPAETVASIDAWISDIEDRADRCGAAQLVIERSMSVTGREMIIDLPGDCYTIANQYAVYHIEHHVAGIDEHIYFVAPAGERISTDQYDADQISTHQTAEVADAAAMAHASGHAGLDEANAGYRQLIVVGNLIDLASLIDRNDGDSTMAYVAGRGQCVTDSGVADVLGTDEQDLMDALSVGVAINSIIDNTGRYVTARQYAGHVLRLAAYQDNPIGWLHDHAEDGLVADILANASLTAKTRLV